MPESVYTHVVAAVEKAAQSPQSQEARDVVLAACEEWFQSHFRTAVLAQDTFPIANSVARRWRRKPIEKWAHIGQHGTEWVAVRRVYFLLFSLLWRLCLAPESLNALVFHQLLWDMDECRLAVRVYDHPSGPVPEVPDYIVQHMNRVFGPEQGPSPTPEA